MNDYEAPPNQKLNTTSSPTFAGLTINGTATFASTVTVTTSIASPLYTSGAGTAIALSPGDNASATDTSGAALNLRSGKGRGAGAASSIVFQTPTVGSTGTTLQTLATRLTVATAGITATVPITVTGGTVTVSTPLVDLSQTWNDGAVTFIGKDTNITATAKAAASLVERWRVGGSQIAAIRNDGVLFANYLGLGSGTTFRGYFQATGDGDFRMFNSAGAALTSLGFGTDLLISRHSAANLRQGVAAANDADGAAQTLRSPGGGTVSSGTTGRNGGAYTITAGNGSDAKSGSNANGGNGGILTLTGGAKGLKDGGGSDGLDGGVQVSRSGGLLGFYGTAPVALQTGVAVSAAGIHAALVNLGLITA